MRQLDEDFLQAIDDNNTEAVKFYLRLGADVNVKSNDGCTALMRASNYGRTDTVALLKQHGAKE